jgi:hypothetical protein
MVDVPENYKTNWHKVFGFLLIAVAGILKTGSDPFITDVENSV